MQFVSHNTQETEQFGEEVAKSLRGGDVLAFTGSLGMGKTAFTRGLARGLGCRGRVTSPTFTIVNEYDGKTPLFHFDMYRLGSSDELFDIGWDDYLARGGVCAVEWSERAEDAAAMAGLNGEEISLITGAPATPKSFLLISLPATPPAILLSTFLT